MIKMKVNTRLSILFIALLFISGLSKGQDKLITKEYKENAIQNLSQLMNDYYVFPEVAKLTEEHLNAQLLNGYYDQFENDETFAATFSIIIGFWFNLFSFFPFFIFPFFYLPLNVKHEFENHKKIRNNK